MQIVGAIALYVATIIGAGFASGQELVVFFVNYGWGGLVGGMVALFILMIGLNLSIRICQRTNATSYEGVLAYIDPRLTRFFDLFYSLFLFVGVTVMLAGIRVTGGTPGVNTLLGLSALVLLTFILLRGIGNVLSVSISLAALMVAVLVVICLKRIMVVPLRLPVVGSWLGLEAGALYGSYNLVFAMAVLSSIHPILASKSKRWLVIACGNGILGGLLFLLIFTLHSLPPSELQRALPTLSLAELLGPKFVLIYRITLWSAMFTTALGNGLALVTRITSSTSLSWASTTVFVLVCSYFFSYLGFHNLIKGAYPLLGIAGLLLFINLIAGFWRENKNISVR